MKFPPKTNIPAPVKIKEFVLEKVPADTANRPVLKVNVPEFVKLPVSAIDPDVPVTDPLFIKKPVAVSILFAIFKVLPALTVTSVQAAFAESVTVKPPAIVTTSPATGTDAPDAPPKVADQVAVELQLPVATEKRFAAFDNETVNNKIKTKKKNKLFAFLESNFILIKC